MYTHTFEIQIDGVNIGGEINFNSGNEPMVKIINGEDIEMKLKEFQTLDEIFRSMQECYRKVGDITKIELNKK